MATLADTDVRVQIPGDAVLADGDDLGGPVSALLQDLSLLAPAEESARATGIKSAFEGPPQSVALIEAGATAATKWWATGFGASVLAAWAKIFTWWGGQHDGIKAVVVGGAFLLTAAAVLGIAYLFAADVRGRAAATVATVQARADVAVSMVAAAQAVHERPAPATIAGPTSALIPLPAALYARNIAARADEEEGWRAIAAQIQADGSRKYLLVNGNREELLGAEDVEFGPAPRPLSV